MTMLNLMGVPLMIIFGEAWMWIVSFLLVQVSLLFGFSLTYHRLLSHKAFKPPKWFYYFGSIVGLLSGYGSPIAAVANHRKHHRFSDTDKDPHVVDAGLLGRIYLRMFKEKDIELMYAKDLLRDKFQVFIHTHYFKIHLLWAGFLALLGWKYLLCVYAVPAAITWVMTSLGSIITHWDIGYRNFDSGDKSTNHWFLQWFMYGEGLHNNHHNNAGLANFAQPGEVDIGYWFIKLLDKDAK